MSKDNAPAPMSSDKRDTDYHLGNTDAEHERLIRQGVRLAPVTERFFREAGIGSGHLVLDLGAGVGDVAMVVRWDSRSIRKGSSDRAGSPYDQPGSSACR